ncbi:MULTISPECIES: subtilase-type protease inhibitor [unclassified Streptomyces]|uniref:subtilase-type protease inhibitor n=1 Tax=unclassified Streptomyces TaxID=2593676 RepID=UPI0022543E48|nr:MULTISPECIES: subtilase-type protease inhibitor [unclassified Streptomyces]MCX4524319.1 subtilase-type protease inhibitor [Streptomyces sp. NBC_01551]MCX4545161.1 subtilase-type protease inhibitor [Streptomyces sp. NBC_01565]
MRSIARGLGLGSAAMALTALTALAWPGTAGAAPSGTESLYAPSALVLGITAGEDASSGTVLRAVTLVCAPTPRGTHPSPAAACAELRANFDTLDAVTEPEWGTACTREWNPMTVTADGVWQGRRMSYSYTFGNPCGLHNTSGSLFGF